MKTKHTPGPWKVVTDNNGLTTIKCKTEEDLFIVSQHYGNYEANAKLIAAAPDLLKMCHSLLILAKKYEDHYDACDSLFVDEANELIEKLT